MRFGLPLALVYVVMIGGTQLGQYSGALRVANALVAGAFIVAFVWGVARRSDRVDLFAVFAFLAFLAACLASAFPRQSLDAALAALVWLAVFYVARTAFSDERRSTTIATTMVALSLVTTAFLARAEFSNAGSWLSLTDGELLPPLGLPIDGRPWGHEYDMAMLAVMLYPAWFIGSMGRLKIAAAALVGAVLVVAIVLLGGRNLWLATVLATVLIAVAPLIRFLAGAAPRTRMAAIGALSAAVVILVAFGAPLLERLLTGATIDQRAAMWASATEAWLDRPIAGYGPGAFPWILQTTDFFSFNIGHHRHAHNAFFQLLPEAGILGLVAAGLLFVGVGLPLLRSGRIVALWPIAVFLLGGIASNPTVYPYLIVVAIVWAAFALPREPEPAFVNLRGQTAVRRLSFVGIVIIGLATIPLMIGGLVYDTAIVAAGKGDIRAARAAIRTATILDPGMALYFRQAGVAGLLLGENDQAIADLGRATRLNPMDGVGWRALALGLSAAGEDEAARRALDEAVLRDRSDASNLLMLARRQADMGDVEGLRQTAAEVVLAWPTVMFAPGWRELLGDVATPEEVMTLALDRWRDGATSPEPLAGQPLLLSILANEPDVAKAGRLTGWSDDLVRASVAVSRCEEDAADVLDAVPADDRRTDVYWALRLQHTSERGGPDPTALNLYELRTGMLPTVERAREHLNPLRQNNTDGALDPFGYGRLPVAWPDGIVTLPSPAAGQSQWLIDQPGARDALGPGGGPASCG